MIPRTTKQESQCLLLPTAWAVISKYKVNIFLRYLFAQRAHLGSLILAECIDHRKLLIEDEPRLSNVWCLLNYVVAY